PLIISEKSLKVEGTHHFLFSRGGRGAPPGRGAPAPAPNVGKLYLNVASVNPTAKGKPVVIWHNPTVSFHAGFPGRGAPTQSVSADGAEDPNAPPKPIAGAGASGSSPTASGPGRGPIPPRVPLKNVVTESFAKKLNFGVSPDGAPIDANDFASELSTVIEVP